MSVRKLGKSWYVDVQWRGRRLRLRSPENTRHGAGTFEQLVRRTLSEHGSIDPLLAERQTEPTFAEFTQLWLRDYVRVNNKPSVIETYQNILRRSLLPSFGTARLREITPQAIEQFKAALRGRGLSAKSVNNQLAVLRRALVLAVEWGQLDAVPRVRFLKTSLPPVRTLSLQDVERVAAAASGALWHALIVVAAYTGARFNEVIALEWGEVDLERVPASMTISRGAVRGHVGATKTYRNRTIPLPRKVVGALRRLPRTATRVFDYAGKLVPYNTARKELRRAATRAGIEPMGWHTLRHTYVTELARRGAPLHTVQRLAGHTSIQTTMRYAHVVPEMLAASVQLLEGPPTQTVHTVAAADRQDGLPPRLTTDERESIPFASLTTENRP